MCGGMVHLLIQVDLACLPAQQQSHAARTGLEQLGLDIPGNWNWNWRPYVRKMVGMNPTENG